MAWELDRLPGRVRRRGRRRLTRTGLSPSVAAAIDTLVERGEDEIVRHRVAVAPVQLPRRLDTVIDSEFVVESDHASILFDRGLFRGLVDLRWHNWRGLPLDAGKRARAGSGAAF
ncbi:hypothetical protein FB157_120153 [Streptomyces sp. BK340]|nr:hypothetical protein FB157_120153 [Streptomyces sp. BK340]